MTIVADDCCWCSSYWCYVFITAVSATVKICFALAPVTAVALAVAVFWLLLWHLRMLVTTLAVSFIVTTLIALSPVVATIEGFEC